MSNMPKSAYMGQKRIIGMVDGRPRSRLVSTEELKRLNTPKEST